jgi:arylsulfatase A-like enzyme
MKNGCLTFLGATLAVVLGGLSLFAAEPARRPNVLFILCDDLRPDALGCYGSKHVKTPHIDRLAADGVRFTSGFCTTSLCSPSRASILTGLYAMPTEFATTSPNFLPPCPTGPAFSASRATRRDTAASGTWVRTTIPPAPASTGS